MTSQAAPNKPIMLNLALQSNVYKLESWIHNNKSRLRSQYTVNILDFIKNDTKPYLCYNKYELYFDPNVDCYVYPCYRNICLDADISGSCGPYRLDKLISELLNDPNNNIVRAIKRKNKTTDNIAGAIVFCQKRTNATRTYKNMFVFNADLSQNGLTSAGIETIGRCPSVSFTTLSRLIGGFDKMIKGLQNQTLWLVDFTDDTDKPLTQTEREVWKNNPKDLIPPAGWTLTTIVTNDAKWHRAATVVWFDDTTERCFLLGFDDSQYFGCELPEPANSIEEAYKILMPEEIRDCVGVKRQGEWFMVPVEDQDLPLETECVLISNPANIELCLPRDNDDDDGNIHRIECKNFMVTKNNQIYCQDMRMDHMEHSTIKHHISWCTLYKNTALQSISQDGVD